MTASHRGEGLVDAGPLSIDGKGRKGSFCILPQRWVLQLAVEGDLRFLSHLDSLRGVERTLARARVPLRFSQGFNPHPLFSIACPRPVGVAARADLLVISLEETVDGEQLARNMNAHALSGMSFCNAREIETSQTPRLVAMRYELGLDSALASTVASRLEELAHVTPWPAERVKHKKSRNPRKPPRRRTLDLRELIESIDVVNATLEWTCRPQGDLWPRPAEVLSLVGLNDGGYISAVVRDSVEYEL